MGKSSESSFKKIIWMFYYGAGQRAPFKKRQRQIEQIDNKLGLALSAFIFFGCIAACLGSAVFPTLVPKRWLLLGTAVLSMLSIASYTVLLRQRIRMPIALRYLYFASVLGIVLASGMHWKYPVEAFYYLLLVFFSMFIMDKPGRINLVFFVFTAAFLLCRLLAAPEQAEETCINCLAAYAASCFISRYAVRARLDEMANKAHIEWERDTDGLTKLFTRRAAVRDISAYLQSGLNRGALSALLLIDVDNFKSVNDTLGHESGDTLLVELSATLRSLLRRSDYVSRLGGDEFIVFLTELPDRDWVNAKAAAINAALRKTVKLGRKSVRVSASVGIAFADNHASTYETLYRNADQAMYAAKQAGGDRFAVYGKLPAAAQTANVGRLSKAE